MLPYQFRLALILFLRMACAFIIDTNRYTTQPRSTLQMATWSNGQAIREYQDFLASGKQDMKKESDGPSLIVKSSKHNPEYDGLVHAICSMGKGDDVIISLADEMPRSVGGRETFPILLVIPPYELNDFIRSLPESWKLRSDDFVFLSGGNLCGVVEPILKSFGYARDTMTQFLVSGFSIPPIMGIGKPLDLTCELGLDANSEVKKSGECASCGKWSGAIQERLERNSIACKSVFYREWRRMMWERASYDAVFNLIGAVRTDPTTIKDVALYYGDEASDMLWQVTTVLRGFLAITLLYGFEERIFGFAEQRGSNDICQINDIMYPYVFPPPFDQCSKIAEYLNYAKDDCKLITAKVPKVSNKPSAMRQGNLRADGVV